MTVAELIEELKKQPQDAECVSINHEWHEKFARGEKDAQYWDATVVNFTDDGTVFLGTQPSNMDEFCVGGG